MLFNIFEDVFHDLIVFHEMKVPSSFNSLFLLMLLFFIFHYYNHILMNIYIYICFHAYFIVSLETRTPEG